MTAKTVDVDLEVPYKIYSSADGHLVRTQSTHTKAMHANACVCVWAMNRSKYTAHKYTSQYIAYVND